MSLAQHVRGWTGGIGVWRKLAVALAAAALASGIATYLALTGAPPFGPRPVLVLLLLNLDLVLLLALAAVVAKRLFEVRAERRRNLAGSRLQVRLVGLFSLIAVLPTIIVAVFSYLFFSFGVETWFSDKVRTAISESVAVADAYVKEHQQAIRADALAMANDLDRYASSLQLNPQYLAPVLTAQAAMRGLTEAAVLDRKGTMLARTGLVFALGFEDVSQDAMNRAKQGEVVIMTDDREERVRAGDLSARVPEGDKDDELVSLSRAFNRITYQIQSQQDELIEANRQLDERRRFTETVLTGVTAGVIGLDRGGRIHLPNRSASALLGADLDLLIGEDLAEIAPEMADRLEHSARRPARLARAPLPLGRADSPPATL